MSDEREYEQKGESIWGGIWQPWMSPETFMFSKTLF